MSDCLVQRLDSFFSSWDASLYHLLPGGRPICPRPRAPLAKGNEAVGSQSRPWIWRRLELTGAVSNTRRYLPTGFYHSAPDEAFPSFQGFCYGRSCGSVLSCVSVPACGPIPSELCFWEVETQSSVCTLPCSWNVTWQRCSAPLLGCLSVLLLPAGVWRGVVRAVQTPLSRRRNTEPQGPCLTLQGFSVLTATTATNP